MSDADEIPAALVMGFTIDPVQDPGGLTMLRMVQSMRDIYTEYGEIPRDATLTGLLSDEAEFVLSRIGQNPMSREPRAATVEHEWKHPYHGKRVEKLCDEHDRQLLRALRLLGIGSGATECTDGSVCDRCTGVTSETQTSRRFRVEGGNTMGADKPQGFETKETVREVTQDAGPVEVGTPEPTPSQYEVPVEQGTVETTTTETTEVQK